VDLVFRVAERDRLHLGGLLSGALALRLFLWLLPFTLLLVGALGAVTAAESGTAYGGVGAALALRISHAAAWASAVGAGPTR
jgi:hypothetical protein